MLNVPISSLLEPTCLNFNSKTHNFIDKSIDNKTWQLVQYKYQVNLAKHNRGERI